jgi:hypothetical protein
LIGSSDFDTFKTKFSFQCEFFKESKLILPKFCLTILEGM